MEVIQTGNFCLPLDNEEAKQHISDRRETLVKVFTEGFPALKYLMECAIKTYGECAPLCLIPYKDGTFEVAPMYKTGVHLPTCLPGINVLWSKQKSSQEEFVRQATVLCNTWLVAYAAYISSRLEPSDGPPIWEAVMLGGSLTVPVEDYYEEEGRKRAAERRLMCGICETPKREPGISCTKCHLWDHVSCAATTAAEKLDALSVEPSAEKDLTDPATYLCWICQ